MNKKLIKGYSTVLVIAVVVGVIVILGLGYKFINSSKSQKEEVTETKQEKKVETVTPTTTVATDSGKQSETGNVVTVEVTGSSFKFLPNTVNVKKGDTVKVVFKNSGGMHDFVIDEFNVRTKRIASGESDEATFTADKVGTFEYYCSVGSHRAMGMKGTLTVK